MHRICRKVDGIFVPSTNLILMFDKPSLPVRMQQYVPNPLCSFKFRRFGHTQEHCISQAICVSCDQKAHSPPCHSSLCCVNCDGPHGSNSRDCPKLQMEKEIQNIRATDNVSFPDTRCCYQAQHSVDSSHSVVSFIKSSNIISSSSQTIQPSRRSVLCHVSLVKLIVDQDKSLQLLKTITPTVKPKAMSQGAEPSPS